MSNKSHVGMGFTVCPVCLTEHDEVVLLHTQMRNVLEQRQATGWGLCPDCQSKRNEGYIALVGVSNKPMELNDAIRTGDIAHLKAHVFTDMFNRDLPPKGMAFVEQGVIEHLKNLQAVHAQEVEISDELT
jgi:type II secretory ATPase GspE/PulE/Tfp pilus assembly ATPase PilB-like protein